MRFSRFISSVFVAALVIALAIGFAPAGMASAADPVTIPLDDAGFGAITVQSVSPNKMAAFAVSLAPGDNLAIDLQGETSDIQVSGLMGPAGAWVPLAGGPDTFNHRALVDGLYSIAVQNPGQQPAGFTLRVVVTHAPLPADVVLTMENAGKTVSMPVGTEFQVALDTQVHEEYAWTVQPLDNAILTQAGDPATILLGTMPGVLATQIFTFKAVAPGMATLALANAKGDAEPETTFAATIEVLADKAADTDTASAAQAAPEPIRLEFDNNGEADKSAQVQGTLEPQAIAAYVVAVSENERLKISVTPANTDLILTVVGADGMPLQTDHAGISSFDQLMPVTQDYTLHVINYGDKTQAFEMAVNVGHAEDTPDGVATDERDDMQGEMQQDTPNGMAGGMSGGMCPMQGMMNGQMSGGMHGQMQGQMNGQMKGCMRGSMPDAMQQDAPDATSDGMCPMQGMMNGQMSGGMHGKMNGGMHGQMQGQMNGSMPGAMQNMMPAMSDADANALGDELVHKYLDAIKTGDKAALEAFAMPAFQIVRANGEVFDRTAFLDNLAVIKSYVVENVQATVSGDALVVSYTAAAEEIIDGKPVLAEPLPRLTIFQQIDGEWKVLAHANFAATQK